MGKDVAVINDFIGNVDFQLDSMGREFIELSPPGDMIRVVKDTIEFRRM